MKNLNRFLFWSTVIIVVALLCYFRLKPIYFQTVPYTYDQGRDFLKAEEIIRDRNLTLIGPTTGIQGLFHGAWWYYYLAVPYLLFGGWPIGFPLFIFLTFLASVLLFFFFLKKELGDIPALFFLGVLAISPYFTVISFFAINSFLGIPFLMLFLFSLYKFMKEEKPLFAFLTFLSLGLTIESELAFGFFIIPSLILTLIITGLGKKIFLDKKNYIYSLSGFLIAFVPRILFEIKNGFMQTKTLFNFIFNSNNFQDKTLREIFLERISTFWNYYLSLFPVDGAWLPLLVLSLGIAGIVLGLKRRTLFSHYLKVILILFFAFFLSTLLYKNTLWANYIEGISLFYVVILAISFYFLRNQSNKLIKNLVPIPLIIVLALTLNSFYKDFSSKKAPELTGMREQVQTVEKIYTQVGKDNLCVRVYTPPVIPYTYDYLFSYYERQGFKKPSDRYVRNKCWLILEKDECKFKEIEVKEKMECLARIENWKKTNIPREATMLRSININQKISVEQWVRK